MVPCFAWPMKVSLALPPRAALWPVFASGGFSAAGYVALTVGLTSGFVAVVVVLSSFSSAVTVLLARVLDKTHVAVHQWLAIGAIVVGIILIRT